MDEISGLVQRRFSAAMDSMQVFVASTKTFSTEYLHMYSGNRYGGEAGEFWPPWVPLEVMFEFEANPYGFSRVVHRTSASLRYDKYNTLRLKYNDDVSGGGGNGKGSNPETAENRMDHVYIEFPHFRAICDSNQYFAMYIIVLDLLLYNEPLEKTRTERLDPRSQHQAHQQERGGLEGDFGERVRKSLMELLGAVLVVGAAPDEARREAGAGDEEIERARAAALR